MTSRRERSFQEMRAQRIAGHQAAESRRRQDEFERLRAIEARARQLVEALFEEDAPRLRAIEEMRDALGLGPVPSRRAG